MSFLNCLRHKQPLTNYCPRCAKCVCIECECTTEHETVALPQYLNETQKHIEEELGLVKKRLNEESLGCKKGRERVKKVVEVLKSELDSIEDEILGRELETLLNEMNQTSGILKMRADAAVRLKMLRECGFEERLALYTLEKIEKPGRPFIPREELVERNREMETEICSLRETIESAGMVLCEHEKCVAVPSSFKAITTFIEGEETEVVVIPRGIESIARDALLSLPSLRVVVLDINSKSRPDDCNFGKEGEYKHIPIFRLDTEHPPLVSFPDTMFKSGYGIPILIHSTKPEEICVPETNEATRFTTAGAGYEVMCVSLGSGKYSIKDKEIEVIEWSEEIKNYGVPESMGNASIELRVPYGAYKVGDAQYKDSKRIVSVHIPATVKVIGEYAFNNCTSLTSVKFMSGVRKINDSAFCSSRIQRLVLHEGLETIGDYAFYNNQMSSVLIPSTVTAIGHYAFTMCASLETVMFRSGSHTVSIGNGAFYETSLESITVPRSVKTIGNHAFDSRLLSSVAFECESELENVGIGAFSGTKLMTITFPPTVRSFCRNVLEDAPIIHIYAPGTAEFDENFLRGITTKCIICFYNCREAPNMYYPDNITIEMREDNPFTE